jgi:hypothetical protein
MNPKGATRVPTKDSLQGAINPYAIFHEHVRHLFWSGSVFPELSMTGFARFSHLFKRLADSARVFASRIVDERLRSVIK